MLIPVVAVEHSRAWHHHGSHIAVALVRMVNHPSINWTCDCITLVNNHDMLTPSYQGFQDLMSYQVCTTGKKLSRNYPIIIKKFPVYKLKIPLPLSAKFMEKAEIMECRRSSRPHKLNPHHIEAASVNLSHLYNQLNGCLKSTGTLNHVETFIVQVNVKLIHVISSTG